MTFWRKKISGAAFVAAPLRFCFTLCALLYVLDLPGIFHHMLCLCRCSCCAYGVPTTACPAGRRWCLPLHHLLVPGIYHTWRMVPPCSPPGGLPTRKAPVWRRWLTGRITPRRINVPCVCGRGMRKLGSTSTLRSDTFSPHVSSRSWYLPFTMCPVVICGK